MKTSGQYDKTFPQLQVVGSKIYYVRQQPDPMKKSANLDYGDERRPDRMERGPEDE